MSKINRSEQKNEMNKSTSYKLAHLFKTSFFISILLRFSDFLYSSVKNSAFFAVLSSYGKTEQLYKNGLFGTIFSKIGLMFKHLRSVKTSFAASCEKSIVLSFVNKTIDKLVSRQARNYGAFLFYFGLYSAVIHLIKHFTLEKVELLTFDFLFSLFVFAVSFLLLPIKTPVNKLIAGSKILSFFFFGLFPYDAENFANKNAQNASNSAFLVLGMVLGALTYFVSPVVILGAIALVCFVAIVFKTPEVGIVFLFSFLPFLPTMVLAAFIMLIFASFIYKLARGKRTLKFELIDIMVLAFCAILFFGGIFSVDVPSSIPPVLVFVCFLSSYFLIVNLIKSIDLVKKCSCVLCVSLTFVSLYGIYQNYFGTTNAAWIDEEMFSDIGNRVVSTFENPNVLGEYFVTVIPIALAMVLVAKTFASKTCYFICSVLSLVCLVFTWSRGAWLGLIAGLVVYVLMLNKRSMILVSLGACSIPLLPFVLPATIVSRFTSIGNVSDSSTSYRLSIYKAVADMLGDYSLSGIGVGEGAFAKIYPAYSYAGIEAAPHSHNLYMQLCLELGIFALIFYLLLLFVFAQYCISFIADKKNTDRSMRLICTGGLCGIFSVLIQGLTDYTWYNYRVYLVFWLIFALCICARRSSQRDHIIVDAEIRHV